MSDLLTRLREATGPSREIDRTIAEAFGFKVEVFRVPDDHPVLQGGLEFMVGADGSRTGIPPYTASIDAALTLVPQGWGFNISDPQNRFPYNWLGTAITDAGRAALSRSRGEGE